MIVHPEVSRFSWWRTLATVAVAGVAINQAFVYIIKESLFE